MIKLTFYTSGFLIIWAMIGYPISILFLGKLIRRTPKKLEAYEPTVTVMVVAHNEEEVIIDKLNNLLNIDYPKDKLEILVSSDFSTDKTNELVKTFIDNNKDENIRLYITKNRGGKTNAQNEAHKTVESEFIVFTDANAILKENAVNELINSFVSEEIIYATGELVYINRNKNETSESENAYWSKEVRIQSIESNIQTITAGNGALYAMKKVDYIDLDPIRSHDAGMPFYAATQRKRAIAVPSAIAYEKAGEVIEGEYKRKVRMNRGIISSMFRTFKVLNVFKYRWFTYFYIGHRGLMLA